MTINCKEAARLVSEGLDKELPVEERLRLRAHLAICRGCKNLSDRLAFLRKAVRKMVDRGESG